MSWRLESRWWNKLEDAGVGDGECDGGDGASLLLLSKRSISTGRCCGCDLFVSNKMSKASGVRWVEVGGGWL